MTSLPLLYYWLAAIHLLAPLSLGAVQQSAPEAGARGFIPHRQYAYEYRSSSSLHQSANITVQARVSLSLSLSLSSLCCRDGWGCSDL